MLIPIQTFFVLLFLLSPTLAFADEADDVFCSKSRTCKKVCDLKRENKYSDLDPENQKLMLKCIEDLLGQNL